MADAWQEQIKRIIGTKHGLKAAAARSVDMSPGQFGDLINKPGRNPQLRTLERIAEALGVKVAISFVKDPQSQEGAAHGTEEATPAPDPEAFRAVATVAVRAAVANILTDLLAALGESRPRPDESPASPRADQTPRRDVSAGRGRAVR